jgi:hypothetical protein
MKERDWIEPIVQRVVGHVLDSHAAQLRTEIVRRVMEEIAAAPEFRATRLDATQLGEATTASSRNVGSTPDATALARAVAEIQLGTSQREILRALLDTGARYASRIALFVVKGSHATGWQGRGFANGDAVKDFPLDQSAPAVIRGIRDRAMASPSIADMDSHFLLQVGTPGSGEVRIFPLILKDKVAALIYADGGTDAAGLLDGGALELLVLSTGAWLEVNSLRKQAQKESSATQVESQSAAEAHQTAVHAVSAYNDPFASHSSGRAMAAAASTAEASFAAFASPAQDPATFEHSSQTVIAQSMTGGGVATEDLTAEVHSASSEFEPSAVAMDAAIAEPLPLYEARTETTIEAPAASSILPADQDVHRKAQRFARLLVDEIKLYNQAKLADGRKNRDLYDRLKEVIEKSRVTYQKRYGSTVAASGDYFHHEIIRSLAEDDLSIMGANFRQ